jgi:tetraacyldisaccharide-1-P 4'-kinase
MKQVIKDFPEDTEKNQRYIDMECQNFRDHYSIKNRKDAMKLTQEQRQEILDLFKTGKTIGEVRDQTKQTQEIVCATITMNIETQEYHTLRKESI